MNLLQVNWSWFPSGGDWIYIENVNDIFIKNGHKIIPFSTQDDRNFKTEYSKYFVSKLDYNSINQKKSLSNSVKVIKRTFYSKEAKQKLTQLLDENKVDIAQLNNIHNHITPSILGVLKKKKIPIVWRVLDYRLICPNTTLVSNGKVCESCKQHNYYMCVAKKCKRESRSASLIAATESYLNYFFKISEYVDLFLFQNEFTHRKFVEFGLPIKNNMVINNPYNISKITPDFSNERYVLYLGRIEKIKGIYTLFNAMKLLPEIKLKVVGVGNELNDAQEYVTSNNLKNISFEGAKWGDELAPIIKKCAFVVVPSEWYEVSPYAILDAYAYGKPVVASNIGGIPEVVDNNDTGILFEPGNVEQLSQTINNLFSNPNEIVMKGNNARAKLANDFSQTNYYEKSFSLFEKLLKNRN
jgi:glycosyltransferase involved in cell wall biosynthesis